jgi:tRNA nucleotidyltransferase (CCA-adding enzyme)
MLDRVTGERIRNEIELALTEADPVRILERLDALGVLQRLSPGLSWRPETAEVFAAIPGYADDPLWGEVYRDGPAVFYYFAVWLAPLTPPAPELAASRLRVRKTTRDQLLALPHLGASLDRLTDDAPPSAIVRALGNFAPRTLLTARMLAEPARAALLDRYWGEWRHVRPALTGDDLRAFGLPPGPRYTALLDRLLAARLDGEATDRAGEEALLKSLL